MSYPGQLSRLAAIANPDVGVLLNVHPVHLEHFHSLSAIAEAKGELFRGMREQAVAVYNADDPEAARVALPFPGEKIGFGFGESARVRAIDLEPQGEEGTAFVISGLGQPLPVQIPFPGRHHVANALAAAHFCLFSGLVKSSAFLSNSATVASISFHIPARSSLPCGLPVKR